MRKALAAASVALALLVLSVGPLHAITFGDLDGTDHPNVGSIVFHIPGIGHFQFCSGTLVEPQPAHEAVFLTASHCTDALESLLDRFPGSEALVTFDPTITPGGTFFTGTLVTNPSYNRFQGPGGRSDPGDIAVILLDDDPGLDPAELPAAGLLDELKASGVLKKSRFTAVGYGATRETMKGGFQSIDPTNVDRRQAEQGYLALTKSWLDLAMVNTPGNENGGTCYGDSGGPHFIHLNGAETDIVTSITVTGDAVCKATDVTYRTDTAAARTFLAPYVDLP